MKISAEVVPPSEPDVVIRMPKKAACELMYVLMNELAWDDVDYGLTTIADIYKALENAGIREA